MVIDSDRTEFDAALEDPGNVFLLVFTENSPLARKVHDMASDPNIVEDWYIAVLFRDMSVLTDDEKKAWYGSDEKYTTLSKHKPNLADAFPTPHNRRIAGQAELSTLCSDGEPSPRIIPIPFGVAESV